MIGNILALFGIAKDLRKILRRIPDGVGFSIVTYGSNGNADDRDHLRIVNLTPLTIHGFKFSVQHGPHGEPLKIVRVRHPSPADVYGRPTIYTVEIPSHGIYMRPGSVFFVHLSELFLPQSYEDVRVSFTYTADGGERLPGNLQYVVRVRAENLDKRNATQRGARPDN